MTQQTLTGNDGPSDELLRLWRAAKDGLGLSHPEAVRRFPESTEHRSAWLDILTDERFTEDRLDDVEEPRAVAWYLMEDATMDEAVKAQAFEAEEALPLDVIRACADPDHWPSHVDPAAIQTAECAVCDQTLYRVHIAESDEGRDSCWVCGSATCFVDEYGEAVHGEYVGDPAGDGYYDVAEDSSGVMCGHCYESMDHGGSTVVVVTPDNGVYKSSYQGTVVDQHGLYKAPDYVVEIIHSIAEGTYTVPVDGWRSYDEGPGEADGLEKIGGGWHSSMDRTDFSDRVNDLTNGDIPLPFPVAVVFGRTSNVCSVGLDIYAPPEHAEELGHVLGGSSTGVDHNVKV